MCNRSTFVNTDFEQNLQDLQKSKNPLLFTAQFLLRQPFFERLKESTIEALLSNKKILIKTLKESEVISMSGKADSTIYVLLNGKIFQRDHDLNKPFEYNIITVAKPGSILGMPSLDHGNSIRPTVWSIVASTIAHVACIPKPVFEELWKESISIGQEIQLQAMNRCDLFDALSPQTKHKIFQKFGKLHKLRPYKLIYEWHRRSRWNFKKYSLYRNYKPIISTSQEKDHCVSPQLDEFGIARKQVEFDSAYHHLAKTVISSKEQGP
jgi:hypothetical protein